jgi:hypothetical protein
MKESIFRKALVCGIFVFFIGVAALPALTTVDFERDSFSKVTNSDTENDERVEIVVELWKPDEVQNYSVWLTQNESAELDNLTYKFKADLDNTKTLNETVIIYVDMIVSLYELGLLPDYLDVNLAQQSTAGCTHESGFTNYENIFSDMKERLESAGTEEEKNAIINEAIVLLDGLGLLPMNMNLEVTQQLANGDNFGLDAMNSFMSCGNKEVGVCENFLCLTSGESNNTHFYNGVEIFLEPLYKLYYKLIEWAQEQDLFQTLPWGGEFFLDLPDTLAYIIELFSIQTRLPVGHLIGFGFDSSHSANGWVHTLGLNGIKEWNGSFYGQISTPEDLDLNITKVGTIGFTGIRIIPSGFYFGAALGVKIGSEQQPGSSENQKELSCTDSYIGLQTSEQIISDNSQPDSKTQDQSIPQSDPSPQNQPGSQQSSQPSGTTQQSSNSSKTSR